MNNKYTSDFYKLFPEVKKQYTQLFTDWLLKIGDYYNKIKPEQDDLDFNTSYRDYLYLKFIILNNSGKVAQAIVADKQMKSIRNYKRSHHSFVTVADSYLSASQVLFEGYEAGNDDLAYPIAILGINYANEYRGDKYYDVVRRIYNHTILKCVDMLVTKDFEKYGFLQAVAYIEYARFNANTDVKTAEQYYIHAANILIKLLSHLSSINEAPSVLFNLANEIRLFASNNNLSSKLLKNIYILLISNKALNFEEGGYFYILKLWYLTQCLVSDKKYEKSIERAERLEKTISKSNVSYYPERYSLYRLMEKIYRDTGNLIDSKRCQILAENIKKICKFAK